jgi:hypothetical protein
MQAGHQRTPHNHQINAQVDALVFQRRTIAEPLY